LEFVSEGGYCVWVEVVVLRGEEEGVVVGFVRVGSRGGGGGGVVVVGHGVGGWFYSGSFSRSSGGRIGMMLHPRNSGRWTTEFSGI